MTDPQPVACTLGASELRHRLDEIATVGAAGLIAHEVGDEAHTLRFRRDPETRRRLEAIVAAEAECCSFLALDLSDRDGELILTLVAFGDGQLVADDLAAAFAGASR